MRIKLLILLVIFSVALSSCVSDEVNIPDHIIPKDTMVEMLAEIQIMESINEITSNAKKEDFDIKDAYIWELDKYNVSEEKFKESLDFYSSHQNLLEEIYDMVIIRITEIEAAFSSKNQKKVEENSEKYPE